MAAVALPLGAAPPGGLSVGSQVILRYNDPFPEWHARLLLSLVTADSWIVLTPDGDIFGEQISGGNRDLLAWRPRPADGSAPYGILLGEIYDFNPAPDAAAMVLLIAEGEVHASAERARLVIPDAAALAAVAAAAAAVVAPVAAEPLVPLMPPPMPAPEGVPPLAGPPAAHGVPAARDAAALGGPAAAGIGAAAGGGLAALAGAIGGMAAARGVAPVAAVHDDARTLPILTDDDGIRFRDFRDGAKRCKTTDFEDWPVSGPRTSKWVLNFMAEVGNPILHHQTWRTNCRLQLGEGAVVEHEMICKVLQTFICYDQIDVANLAGCELLVRNLQRIEEKYKEKAIGIADDTTGGESILFMGGTSNARAGLCISPALQQWIGTELSKEAMISKERRKAREERTLGRKPKGKEGG
jgi:hypothetical protein